MKKVLITGMGIGKELGVCDACNLNLSWLVSSPGTLLWADKICIPKSQYDLHIQLVPENNKLSLNSMIQQLSDTSIISSEDTEVIKRFLYIRNQAVHMKSTDYTFTQSELKTLFSKTDEIIRKMKKIM